MKKLTPNQIAGRMSGVAKKYGARYHGFEIADYADNGVDYDAIQSELMAKGVNIVIWKKAPHSTNGNRGWFTISARDMFGYGIAN